MLGPETYSEILSPSGASFRTVDDPASTPQRTGSPAPARRADERTKLLDHSEDDEYVEYGVEQVGRVERRRGSSTYAVINTGTSSGVGPAAIPGLDDDVVGEFSYPFLPAVGC